MRVEPDKKLARHQRTLCQLEGAGAERIERGQEVSAVDRRNEWRCFKRLEGLCIVPVVEMPTVFFQPLNRGETALGEQGKLRSSDEPKLAGSLARIEQKP